MFDSYYLLNKKVEKHIVLFPCVIFLIFILLLLLLTKGFVPIYLEGTLTKDYDTNSLFILSIPLNKLRLIQNHNQIVINEKKYNYQINRIDTREKEVLVYLEIDIKDTNWNSIQNYKIETAKISLLDYLIKN